MGALSDCEAVVDQLLGQPVNALTTVAFLAVGLLVLVRSARPWVGVACIATGVGSFLFHGPMPAYSEWAHDATLAWLLLVVAADGRPWERWARLPGLAVIGALTAIPGVADPLAVALAAFAIVAVVRNDRSWSTVGPMTLLVVVAVIGRLGATGWPLCDPESPWQAHGLWHVGSAIAVAWWAMAAPVRRPRPTSAPAEG